MKESCNYELACLNKKKNKKKKEKHLGHLATSNSGSVLLRCFFTPLGMLLVMKTPKDEHYVGIKAL